MCTYIAICRSSTPPRLHSIPSAQFKTVILTGLRFRGSEFRVQFSGFRFQVAGCKFQVAGFRLQVAGFRFIPSLRTPVHSSPDYLGTECGVAVTVSGGEGHLPRPALRASQAPISPSCYWPQRSVQLEGDPPPARHGCHEYH